MDRKSERCSKTDRYAAPGQRHYFFQKREMIAPFFVGQVCSADVKEIVGASPLKFISETHIQKRVTGSRRFKLGDAILIVDPLAFDARSPVFAFIIQRCAVTERRDARQWFAGVGILRVDVVGLYPQIKIIRIRLRRLFSSGDNVLDRF